MSSQGPTSLMVSNRGETSQLDPFYAQFRDQSRFWVQRVAVPLIMVIGLFGNLITVIIMTRRRMRSTTNMYLAALALVDMLYLMLTFLLGLSHYPNMAERSYYIYWKLRPFLMMFTDACSNTSVWLTVTFTIERFIAVRYPMKGKVWCTELRAKRLIAFVFLFGITCASPVPFEWEVVEKKRSPTDEEAANILTLENSDFGKNETYKTIYYWSTAVIFYFVPLLLLTFFNGFLILSVHRSLRERNRMTTGQQSGHRNHQFFSKDSPTLRLVGHDNLVRVPIEGMGSPTHYEGNNTASRTLKPHPAEEILREFGMRQQGSKNGERTRADCERDLISEPNLGTGLSDEKMLKSEFDKSVGSISDHASERSREAEDTRNFIQHSCHFDKRVELGSSTEIVRDRTPTVQPKCDNMNDNIKNTANIVSPNKIRCNGDGRTKLASVGPIKPIMLRTNATGKTRPTSSELSRTNDLAADTDNNIISESTSKQNCEHESGCIASLTAAATNASTTLPPVSSQERRITIMLIAVVILFLCCQIPSAAMLLYTSVRELTPNTNEHALVLAFGNIFNFLMAVNAAGNFILYSFLSKKYRRTFIILFCNCFQSAKHGPDKQTGSSRYLSAHYWIGNRSQTSPVRLIHESRAKGPKGSVFKHWSKGKFVRDKLGFTRQLTLQSNERRDELVESRFVDHQRRDTLV